MEKLRYKKNFILVFYLIITLVSLSKENMKMIFPPRLRWNDTIMVIGLGTNASTDKLEEIERKLKQLGFRVKFGKSCYINYGYLAGSDEVRLQDLHDAFSDPEVKAIVSLRGGYGSPRILDKINYDLIRRNPKIFVGYSDVTAVHVAINQNAGLITYHGPMAASNFYYGLDSFSHKSFFDTVMKNKKVGRLLNPEYISMKTLVPGVAKGRIVGGNLTMLSATLGTPYEVDTKGKIFFIEEAGSRVFEIDRMLTQLRLAGKFDDAEGIIFGRFTDYHGQDTPFTILDMFEIAKESKKPIIYNFQVGHTVPMITLPLGANIFMDAEKKIIQIIEKI